MVETFHVCAPGASIISSVNTYAVENTDLGYTDMALQGKLEKGGKKYYWHQSLGTSMATPVVAGAIALWLEAKPKFDCQGRSPYHPADRS